MARRRRASVGCSERVGGWACGSSARGASSAVHGHRESQVCQLHLLRVRTRDRSDGTPVEARGPHGLAPPSIGLLSAPSGTVARSLLPRLADCCNLTPECREVMSTLRVASPEPWARDIGRQILSWFRLASMPSRTVLSIASGIRSTPKNRRKASKICSTTGAGSSRITAADVTMSALQRGAGNRSGRIEADDSAEPNPYANAVEVSLSPGPAGSRGYSDRS